MEDLVLLARSSHGALVASALGPGEADACRCCGAAPAVLQVAGFLLCRTCVPAFALDEPGIDDIASLIWLPHVDQGVLGRIVAALHAAAGQQGLTIHDVDLRGQAALARMAFDALKAQEAGAIARIGTARPSALRTAALALDQVARRRGETGLRVLFNGNWFANAPDRYFETIRSRIPVG